MTTSIPLQVSRRRGVTPPPRDQSPYVRRDFGHYITSLSFGHFLTASDPLAAPALRCRVCLFMSAFLLALGGGVRACIAMAPTSDAVGGNRTTRWPREGAPRDSRRALPSCARRL